MTDTFEGEEEEDAVENFEFCGSLRVLYARTLAKTLDGSATTRDVTVRPDEQSDFDGTQLTAEHVCARVHAELGLELERLRVVWQGRLLDGHERLHALGARTESTVPVLHLDMLDSVRDEPPAAAASNAAAERRSTEHLAQTD